MGMGPMVLSMASGTDHRDPSDVRWIPASITACYECGVYYDGNDDANYCVQCGEELWTLEKA